MADFATTNTTPTMSNETERAGLVYYYGPTVDYSASMKQALGLIKTPVAGIVVPRPSKGLVWPKTG